MKHDTLHVYCSTPLKYECVSTHTHYDSFRCVMTKFPCIKVLQLNESQNYMLEKHNRVGLYCCFSLICDVRHRTQGFICFICYMLGKHY